MANMRWVQQTGGGEDAHASPHHLWLLEKYLERAIVVGAAEGGQLVSRQCAPGQLSPCIFEYIYLARPDSVLNDIPVYSFQLGLGTRLAQRIRCAQGSPEGL
jgi:hypothetical protein